VSQSLLPNVNGGRTLSRRKSLLWLSIVLAVLTLTGFGHGCANMLALEQSLRNPSYLAMMKKIEGDPQCREALRLYWTLVALAACGSIGAFALYVYWTRESSSDASSCSGSSVKGESK
jgi:predicted small lipoprotein YifL